jgi:hypothetical protein
MRVPSLWTGAALGAAGLLLVAALHAQEAAPAGDPPAAPQGVEVLARGPVHEAFASLTAEAVPTQPVPRHAPKAIEEMPPAEKPDGDVLWIPGYWQWDDERKDFLWVSGIWRVPPPGKRWVAGYWRDDSDQSQWVPGFWADNPKDEAAAQQVTYLPQPPAPPQVAPPGEAPGPDTFYVPGHWVWNGVQYAWQAGYWARIQPGFVWIPGHYRWTPTGYIYIAGYWDLAVAERGVMYAPVYITPSVVTVGFVYTPAYVVSDTLVVDAMFVRPCCCHYYFGDYYGPTYRDYGFETCVVYSRHCYEPVFVYACYEHRDEPSWVSVQINLGRDRDCGRASCPPRTLVQQTTIINNITVNNVNKTTINNVQMLAPASQLSKFKGVSTVRLAPEARVQVRQQAQAVQQVVQQRQQTEVAAPGGAPARPRVAALNVPKAQPLVVKAPSSGPGPKQEGRKLGVDATKQRVADGTLAGGKPPSGSGLHPAGFKDPTPPPDRHVPPNDSRPPPDRHVPPVDRHVPPSAPPQRPGSPLPPPPNGQHPPGAPGGNGMRPSQPTVPGMPPGKPPPRPDNDRRPPPDHKRPDPSDRQ